jgi:hypothetical protein
MIASIFFIVSCGKRTAKPNCQRTDLPGTSSLQPAVHELGLFFAAMPFLGLSALAPTMPLCLQNINNHKAQAFMNCLFRMVCFLLYFYYHVLV